MVLFCFNRSHRTVYSLIGTQKHELLIMNIFRLSVSDVPPPRRNPNPRFDPVPERCLKYSEDIAVVEREILPSYKGRVKYQGVSWLAQCERNLAFYPNDRVLVVDRRHITLIVEPLPSGDFLSL